MASSSVSQESLDRDDYDFVGRVRGGSGAGRVRAVRGRGWCASTSARYDSMASGERQDNLDGTQGPQDFLPPSGLADVGETGEHDSPTRTPSRLKDKRGRPIHLHGYKGKTVKDKRKLREKRRSTGVVHLASESTGDSLDEDEKIAEARRNTSYNEVIDADNPQTPEEDRKGYGTRTRNKSPSDLEADFEDNQDYDSTVSQSETNLTMIGRAPPPPHGSPSTGAAQPTPGGKFRMRNPIADSITLHKSSLSSITTTPGGTDPDSCKEDEDEECLGVEDTAADAAGTSPQVNDVNDVNEKSSSLSASSSSSSSTTTNPTTSHHQHHHHHHHHHQKNSEQQKPQQAEIISQAQPQTQTRPVSYPSRFVDRDPDMEGYMAAVTAPAGGGMRNSPLKSSLSNRMQQQQKDERVAGSGGAGGREHVRFRDKQSGGMITMMTNQNAATENGNAAALQARLAQMEQALAEERRESQRLRESLFDRDAVISDLKREITLLHKELEIADEEFRGVKHEKHTLLKALASLGIDC